ncbi:MAG: hypothetical protein QE277_04720 [Flectobacillus sp.]|nr:hypothetical protein [Flectobacillus sp.]
MSILNFKRKEKKITVKFFLRKDRGEVKMPDTHRYGADTVYYPLYIEFIHRRKINRCKSLFLEFHKMGTKVHNIPYTYFNEFGVATREFTSEIENLINGDSSLVRSYQFDLLDLLICEKHHALNLFKLFEDISDDDFIFSNLSEGYHYSLSKRADSLYDEVLKELLLDEFQKLVPSYPIEPQLLKIALSSYSYYEFYQIVVNIFNMTATYARAEVSSSSLMHLGQSLYKVQTKIQEYMAIKPHRYSEMRFTLTIPVWVVEGHSNKLSVFLKEDRFFDRTHFKSKQEFDGLVDTILSKAEEKLIHEVSTIKSYFGYTPHYS